VLMVLRCEQTEKRTAETDCIEIRTTVGKDAE